MYICAGLRDGASFYPRNGIDSSDGLRNTSRVSRPSAQLSAFTTPSATAISAHKATGAKTHFLTLYSPAM